MINKRAALFFVVTVFICSSHESRPSWSETFVQPKGLILACAAALGITSFFAFKWWQQKPLKKRRDQQRQESRPILVIDGQKCLWSMRQCKVDRQQGADCGYHALFNAMEMLVHAKNIRNNFWSSYQSRPFAELESWRGFAEECSDINKAEWLEEPDIIKLGNKFCGALFKDCTVIQDVHNLNKDEVERKNEEEDLARLAGRFSDHATHHLLEGLRVLCSTPGAARAFVVGSMEEKESAEGNIQGRNGHWIAAVIRNESVYEGGPLHLACYWADSLGGDSYERLIDSYLPKLFSPAFFNSLMGSKFYNILHNACNQLSEKIVKQKLSHVERMEHALTIIERDICGVILNTPGVSLSKDHREKAWKKLKTLQEAYLDTGYIDDKNQASAFQQRIKVLLAEERLAKEPDKNKQKNLQNHS